MDSNVLINPFELLDQRNVQELSTHLRAIFKKLSKNDLITQRKGLRELEEYIELECDDANWKTFKNKFVIIFNQFSLSSERELREAVCKCLLLIIGKNKKWLQTVWEEIIVSWMGLTCDPVSTVANMAQIGFKRCFTPEKIPVVCQYSIDIVKETFRKAITEAKSNNNFEILTNTLGSIHFLLDNLSQSNKSFSELEVLINENLGNLLSFNDNFVRHQIYSLLQVVCRLEKSNTILSKENLQLLLETASKDLFTQFSVDSMALLHVMLPNLSLDDSNCHSILAQISKSATTTMPLKGISLLPQLLRSQYSTILTNLLLSSLEKSRMTDVSKLQCILESLVDLKFATKDLEIRFCSIIFSPVYAGVPLKENFVSSLITLHKDVISNLLCDYLKSQNVDNFSSMLKLRTLLQFLDSNIHIDVTEIQETLLNFIEMSKFDNYNLLLRLFIRIGNICGDDTFRIVMKTMAQKLVFTFSSNKQVEEILLEIISRCPNNYETYISCLISVVQSKEQLSNILAICIDMNLSLFPFICPTENILENALSLIELDNSARSILVHVWILFVYHQEKISETLSKFLYKIKCDPIMLALMKVILEKLLLNNTNVAFRDKNAHPSIILICILSESEKLPQSIEEFIQLMDIVQLLDMDIITYLETLLISHPFLASFLYKLQFDQIKVLQSLQLLQDSIDSSIALSCYPLFCPSPLNLQLLPITNVSIFELSTLAMYVCCQNSPSLLPDMTSNILDLATGFFIISKTKEQFGIGPNLEKIPKKFLEFIKQKLGNVNFVDSNILSSSSSSSSSNFLEYEIIQTSWHKGGMRWIFVLTCLSRDTLQNLINSMGPNERFLSMINDKLLKVEIPLIVDKIDSTEDALKLIRLGCCNINWHKSDVYQVIANLKQLSNCHFNYGTLYSMGSFLTIAFKSSLDISSGFWESHKDVISNYFEAIIPYWRILLDSPSTDSIQRLAILPICTVLVDSLISINQMMNQSHLTHDFLSSIWIVFQHVSSGNTILPQGLCTLRFLDRLGFLILSLNKSVITSYGITIDSIINLLCSSPVLSVKICCRRLFNLFLDDCIEGAKATFKESSSVQSSLVALFPYLFPVIENSNKKNFLKVLFNIDVLLLLAESSQEEANVYSVIVDYFDEALDIDYLMKIITEILQIWEPSRTVFLDQIEFTTFDFSFINQQEIDIIVYTANIFFRLLKTFPAIIRRNWFNQLSKQSQVEFQKWTIKYTSPLLIQRELSRIRAASTSINNVSFQIQQTATSCQVIVNYQFEEMKFEMIFSIPSDLPFTSVSINEGIRLGISQKKWRSWLLAIQSYLSQNIPIVEAVRRWKANVDVTLEGIEPCAICYCVLQPSDRTLPNPKCGTCKNKFHSACLYKWFKSGGQATCPMCRSIF